MSRAGWGRAAILLLHLLLLLALTRSAAAQDRPSENDMFGGPPAAPAAPPEAKPKPQTKPETKPDDGNKPPAEPKPGDGQPPAEPKPQTKTQTKPQTNPDDSQPPAEAKTIEEAPPPPAMSVPPAAAAATGAIDRDSRDQTLLGDPNAGPQLSSEAAPENPLTIGGQLYLRAQTVVQEHTYPDHWTLTSPSLLDAYFDARPNDRVRAFIRARVSYDPTAAPSGAPPGGVQGMTSGGGALTGSSVTGFTTFNASRGPNTVLDQMWMAFDIERTVFVTAGKQHVKWGTGRFWTPTDFLHPVKRNPLDVFDARPGTSMLKLHFPWEARAWNFYAFGVFEDPNTASNTLRQVAAAARAELVYGPAELGLDVLVKRDQQPRAGADLSVGVGDFDLYTDVGLRAGSEIPIVETQPVSAICSSDLSKKYHVVNASGIKPQVVGGVTWARKYNDNDVFTIGGEYFYNSVGYSDPSLYPGLLFNDRNTPMLNFFYTGRHYAALFASLPAPGSWNYTNFTLSTIGNLSDLSFVTRFDYSVTLLTHLTFEAFVAGHYGHLGGEFRLGFQIEPQVLCDANGVPTGAVISFPPVNAPIVDMGVALRLKI